MARLLFILNSFESHEHTPEGMLSQLAVEAAARGHSCTVLASRLEENKPPPDLDLEALSLGSLRESRPGRAASVALSLRRRRALKILASRRFDAVVLSTPAMRYRNLLNELRANDQAKVTVVAAYDFYPQAWEDLQLIRSRSVLQLLALMERRAVRGSSLMTLSPASAEFADRYYGQVDSFVVPPFGPPALDGIRPQFSTEGVARLVFGARVFYGRWVEGLIRLGDHFAGRIHIDCYGGDDLRDSYADLAALRGVKNISFRLAVGRGQYIDQLTQYDAGLATTASLFQAPSYPSKFIDYMRVGLPIVAIVDDFTDYPSMIEDEARCGFGARSSNWLTAVDALERLLEARDARQLSQLGENGRSYYARRHTLTKAADIFLHEIERRISDAQ